jgi:hypothetical protein
MSLLSFVARPFFQESPTSILIRTAKCNGYRNVVEMRKALNISLSSQALDLRLLDHPLFNLMCSEAPCLADDLRQIFYELPAKQLLRGCHIKVQDCDVSTRSLRRQFFSCPACLKLGYSRVPQDFAYFDFCPAHNVLLTRSCPNCGRINEWKKICGFTCKCGFNLADAEVSPYRQTHQIIITSSFGVQDASSYINDYFIDEAKKAKLAEPYHIESAPLELFYAQIQNAIQMDLNTYRQLPVSALQSVWAMINEPELRQHAIDYLLKNHDPFGRCQQKNCCSAIKLSFRQLQYALYAGVQGTRSLITEMSILKERLPTQNTIAYSHPSLCLAIRAGTDPTRWHRIPQRVKDHSSLCAAAVLLKTTTTSMAAALKRGFFPNTVMCDRLYSIPNASINEFNTHFVFDSEISDLLHISSRTLNRISGHLNLNHAFDRHLEEPAIYLRSSMNLDLMRKTLKSFTFKNSHGSPAYQKLKNIATQFDITVTVLYHILKVYCGCNTPSKKISQTQILKLQKWLAAYMTLKAASERLNTHVLTLNIRFVRSNLIEKIDICRVRFVSVESFQYMDTHLKRYMSCLEASKLLNISEGLVNHLVQQGKIKYITIHTSVKRSQILIEI